MKIFPLLGGQFDCAPVYLPFDDDSELLRAERMGECQIALQAAIDRHLAEVGARWGISGYPEKRANLRGYARITDYETPRPYHIGVDISVPAGTKVFAPLDGEVVISAHEDGAGNYGGLIVLRHCAYGRVFYSVYGHMDANSLAPCGEQIKAGELLGIVGNMQQNGDWWEHIHLQVLTEKGFNEGFAYDALCTEEDFARIAELCPNPAFLLAYQ
ncbi:MAG: peptidoglycan DD-metalloendopeptidase family protein [Clostridiales bacterium]|jgi:murein DD-endopeptidase MepM/ murein hydrolase activator NlpD|nr:peptidoglycan DD-metalloendopeptidase family protein [Clostridiales bacterium]